MITNKYNNMKFYKRTDLPKLREGSKDLSVEVIISDEICDLNVAYYNFSCKKWYYVFCNEYYDDFITIDFVWWYPPASNIYEILTKRKIKIKQRPRLY